MDKNTNNVVTSQQEVLFPGYCSPTFEHSSSNGTSSTTSPDNLSAGSSSTELFKGTPNQFDILAEAAKRAEMSILIRDMEEL
ncbi:hypothetical protein TRICI_002138 [Trichomonascus ciferrii]|uniref:Uncharacterized protein n=1 Tax=Trichomonascus ciferrii TaxID=44093 RepID=A0A642V7N6_9ASCO|nr:hypothetical protein TRICI_002138 [Trichomonascus ciferrii]